MGRNRRHSLPQVRLHSGSGHARVRINGTEHWLGLFGSPEARAAYDRLLAEYLANGRQVAPKAERQESPPPIPQPEAVPANPCQKARKKSASPKRPPRDRYEDAAINRCIRRACEKAGIPRWTPLQLRHAAGTEARSVGGGLDAAQARLGHKNANITQVYAEVSREKAAELALKLG